MTTSRAIKLSITLLAGFALVASYDGVAPMRAAGCDPVGNVRFICGQAGPEDLFPVPGGEWVLSSGMAPSGSAIRAINVRDRTTTVLFPSTGATIRPDTKAYKSCPGPIDTSQQDKFRAHGLYLRPGSGAVHTLYVVHHGTRESVEVFELDARSRPPALTWIGCVVAPDPIGLNSVVSLPDGGFLTTNFTPRGVDPAVRAKMMAGENLGEVWEWHTATGWTIVPGSESAGPNGLEISKDGKWLYIGGWGSQTVIRLSRGQAQAKKDSVPAGFRVDNLRWAPNGLLIAAGQGGAPPSQTSHIGTLNPTTMKFEEVVKHPYSDVFGLGTVAIQVGKEYWLGSVRGDRIAVFQAPPRHSD
jgi:hypothetical protein